MASTLPQSLIEAINAKYAEIDTALTEARAMLAEGRYANTKNSRRQLM